MALENFNELLHKLKILHEREIEGWQERVLELTNQKCCSDTKRMEELFSKNQQLREQQRVLTENIKQLENRLRAGLCDRCTVTQDVAKRKQQQFESSQIQSLQHISVLASEMNALRKENRRLQEEVKSLQSMMEGQNGHSSQVSTPEVAGSPDPVHASSSAMKTSKQPQAGYPVGLSAVKSDPEHFGSFSAEEKLPGYRISQNWNMQEAYNMSSKGHVNSSPISPGQRFDVITARGNLPDVKRTRSVDAMESLRLPSSTSHPPTSPLLLWKGVHLPTVPSSSSSSPSPSSSAPCVPPWDEKLSTHPAPAPMLFRPRPIKRPRLSLPWPLAEHQEWVLTSTPPLLDGSRKAALKEQLPSEGSEEHHQSHSKRRSLALLPNIALALRDHPSVEEQWKDRERQEVPLHKMGVKEDSSVVTTGEAPLDLSDRRRSKTESQLKCPKSSPISKAEVKEEIEGPSNGIEMKAPSQSHTPPQTSSFSSCLASTLSPQQACFPASVMEGHNQTISAQSPQEEDERPNEEKEEVNPQKPPKPEQKKVPVLTISLRPVVVLEALKRGLDTEESPAHETPAIQNQEGTEKREQEDLVSPHRSQDSRRTRRGQVTGDALHHQILKDQRDKVTISQGNAES